MLHASITAYRGYLVFERWGDIDEPKLGASLLALGVQAQRIVDTDRNLGISKEALAMMRGITIQVFGHVPNLSWIHEPGYVAELSWRGPAHFWSTPGTMLASIGSSLHGHVVIANETSPRITALIDAKLGTPAPTTTPVRELLPA